jgi:penicillin-insensitive murein endopeptidase
MKEIILVVLLLAPQYMYSQNSCDVPNSVEKFATEHPSDGKASKASGTASSGSLRNGKLLPWCGTNWSYFDVSSYKSGRAFLHSKALDATLKTYKRMESLIPGRQFKIMECSRKEGGEMKPHRTHRNGLSIDFMMPKLKDGQPYYGLDDKGQSHYLLAFDDSGRLKRNKAITLDFETIALHLLTLDKEARKKGLYIKKVIINTNLKTELYSGKHGKKLKSSGIYVVKLLEPMINALHDEHYHVDFGFL